MHKRIVVLCAALAGCSSIDLNNLPPADWPTLEVREQYVPYARVAQECEVSSPRLLVQVYACTVPDFEHRICNIYYPNDVEPPEQWVKDHELLHCKGYDHPHDNELHDAWAKYKTQHPGAPKNGHS